MFSHHYVYYMVSRTNSYFKNEKQTTDICIRFPTDSKYIRWTFNMIYFKTI